MNPKHATGAEEIVQADIEADGMESPTAAKEIHTALDPLPGVESVDISEDEITVEYDPTQVTKKDLVRSVEGSGHHVEESKAGRTSPLS